MKNSVKSKSTTLIPRIRIRQASQKDARQQDRNQVIPLSDESITKMPSQKIFRTLEYWTPLRNFQVARYIRNYLKHSDCANKEEIVRGSSRGQNSIKETQHSNLQKLDSVFICYRLSKQTILNQECNLYPLRVTYLGWTVVLDWMWKI